MPPPANPWPVLESIRGLNALPDVWAAKLAENLPAFKILCLQESAKQALAVTCPRDCGCYHTVIHRHDHTGAIAICRCDPPNCPDIPVTNPEITPLEVNRPRLGRALAKALNCQSKTAVLKPRETYQFGSWSADAVPVILTIQTDPYVFRSAITELALRLRRPFILFAPTNVHVTADCYELLADAKAGFFAMDATLQLTEHGTLQPVKPPGELFAQFTPQPNDSPAEEVARQTLALAKTLASEQRFRKAPVYTVFLLYCVDGLTPKQIARKLGCAGSLVYARLQLLAEKLGRHPTELRQYSAHFESMEDSLSDPRARDICRQNA